MEGTGMSEYTLSAKGKKQMGGGGGGGGGVG